jgi:hypothetical protein
MSKYYSVIKLAGAIIVLFLIATLPSCTKNFQKINATWNGAASASLLQLYTGIGAQLDNTAEGEDNAGTEWLYPITQQGAVYASSDFGYGGGANWSGFYQNLANMNQMLQMIDANADSVNYTNVKAMIKVLRAYQAIELSNFYGDIPYSKAGNGISGSVGDLTVPYDKQQDVYLSCLNDLTWAVNNFTTTDPNQYSFASSEFLLLNDIDQWVKFANSLRLRYAVTMYDKDNADAGTIITDAISKPLLSDPVADVVGLSSANIPGLSFDGTAGNGRGFSFRQECRLRMGTTMWNLMTNNNNTDGSGIFDPRCKIYFEVNGDSLWVPYPQDPVTAISDAGDPYNTARDNDWSTDKVGNQYSDFNYYWGRDGNAPASNSIATVPDIFITPAEVHFLKAEVYARGIGGIAQNTATAQTEYEAGVTASVTFWSTMAIQCPIWIVDKPAALPTAGDISTLLANPKVAFNGANAAQLIYAQEWVDLFRQPWVAWTLMRRTGGLTPMDTTNPAGYNSNYGSLQRYQYPGDEQLYNNANWKVASTGGANDLTSTKIWIAK